MSKKYELLKDDYILCMGRTLYRIKALKDFDDIKAGDLGGYIESEDNLSHEGNCWVYKNAIVYNRAKVYDNAEIYGNTEIYNNAEIFENAKIYGNASVFGNAQVYGNAKVCDHAWVSGNSKTHGIATICGDAIVFGEADIIKGNIIGDVSMPYKNIFQHQCEYRILTAILTEDDQILYSVGCQENITEKEFVDRIYNKDDGLKYNPHREEYLKLIPLIKIYFKGE